MSPREIEVKIEEIGAFSQLGQFLDIPVRCYSSGMLLRLAFATSTAVDPQILLLDEVMAAGDEAFIERARRRMNGMMDRADIVIFASHSLAVLPTFCSRTIWLDHGRILMDGPTEDVIGDYRKAVAASLV
jgi:lipopolysaccharide transport system ATP-binding protein